jgi:hypothetical protein
MGFAFLSRMVQALIYMIHFLNLRLLTSAVHHMDSQAPPEAVKLRESAPPSSKFSRTINSSSIKCET